MHRLLLLLLGLAASGCVLDRTGQSANEQYRRQFALHGARLGSLESDIDKVAQRVVQLEELNRARGQDEILKMETLEQVRGELARLRGDLELLGHQSEKALTEGGAYQQDAAFRIAWLEARADQIEGKLKIKPPPPPDLEAPAEGAGAATTTSPTQGTVGGGNTASSPTAATVSAPTATDADGLMAEAEQKLAAGDEAGAEAALDRFLELFPTHKRVAEARYRRAEAAFNDKQYAQAVLRFQEVIDKHKDSNWAPWAMLRQGESFEAQGQPDNARLFFEDVVRLWPKSKAAVDAKRKLK
jgi:tol-pal system protein YbgF